MTKITRTYRITPEAVGLLGSLSLRTRIDKETIVTDAIIAFCGDVMSDIDRMRQYMTCKISDIEADVDIEDHKDTS